MMNTQIPDFSKQSGIYIYKLTMWHVNITCDGAAWKRYAAEFQTMAEEYQSELIGSKKMPDGTSIMSYKIEDVSDAEEFQEKCANFPGFTSDLESL